MRIKLVLHVFVPLAVIFSGNFFPAFSKSRTDGLNVLLITIDTIRPDRLSCYSRGHLETPRIEGLGGKGVVFERAFAHNPLTLPSHVNILLGTTPLYHGVSENSKSVVSEELLTLAEHLKGEGYATGAFVGAFPLDSRFGLGQGFDVYDDNYPSRPSLEFTYAERRAEKVIDASLGWLKGRGGKWFCWVHLWDPHAPYAPPEPFLTEFKADPYSGEVAYVDREVGRLLDYIEKEGLGGRTLIILTGDHGESLGEHGELTHSYFAYNSTIWVPLIIVGPRVKAGRVKDYVSHVDLFPTVCEFLGVERPSYLQGRSLVPLLKGKGLKGGAIYFESLEAYLNRGWAPLRGVIEGGKKFIESPIPELYDLEKDFGESENLAKGGDLGGYQKRLGTLEKEYGSELRKKSGQRADRETLEKLRALGYTVSPAIQVKDQYGPEDDLKTLLPFQQKFDQAITLDDEGEKEKSRELLGEIVRERKDFVPAIMYLARVLRSLGLIEDSLRALEEGVRNNPQNFTLLSAFGLLSVTTGRLDQGIEHLERALALYELEPEAWNYLGVAYWRKGEYQKALDHYNRALALDSSYALVISNLGALYLSLYYRTKKSDDLARSIGYFEDAVRLDPGLTIAYRALGMALKLSDRLGEAMGAWEKAIAVTPDDDFAVYQLGMAHLQKGEKPRALEYFLRYLALKDKDLSPEEREKIEALIRQCKQE
jgi:arylsulfatase A-like enzyme/Flp pilus assembly protein TadD